MRRFGSLRKILLAIGALWFALVLASMFARLSFGIQVQPGHERMAAIALESIISIFYLGWIVPIVMALCRRSSQ